MTSQPPTSPIVDVMEHFLAYLNFSSGSCDPKAQHNFNTLFAHFAAADSHHVWERLGDRLRSRLAELHGATAVFSEVEQAQDVLETVWRGVLPAYLEHHRDQYFHLGPDQIFRPFFLTRVIEMVLTLRNEGHPQDRVVSSAISRLNDFIGYRPVATLESQKIEPYGNEWLRPIPIYIRDVGSAFGAEQQVVDIALDILNNTPDSVLRAAYFHPRHLDELAVDPRAYDFDHPVNKRPNYHFGQWDPHHIGTDGRYHRYVIQQVTLDAMLARTHESDLPAEELVFEAAAVLAGTILMGAGVSGEGPDTFDSTVSLSTLLRPIADYRDAFYGHLIDQVNGEHRQRLDEESSELRQPFGGVRQHLNAELARRRASQLEHVHLAKVFAVMGYENEANEQANIVPAASARMLCQMDCLLAAGRRHVERGELRSAADLIPQVFDVLQRGIQCGAVVDPWNILGFDSHFSLFRSLENSVHDHRVDELLNIIDRIFSLYSMIWSEASARDDAETCQRMDLSFASTVDWWRKYAAHESSSLNHPDAEETFRAAQLVAKALRMWHDGGAEAGDIRFWAPHAAMFDSPDAYGLVVDALLQRGDFVASMALLTHWLSQASRLRLEQGENSFYALCERWLFQLSRADGDLLWKRWEDVRKFFDYLEPNAADYWHAPKFILSGSGDSPDKSDTMETANDANDANDEEGENVFDAAYENVVFKDSADDGTDGSLDSNGFSVDADELANETERISDRLAFFCGLARFWQITVMCWGPCQKKRLPADVSRTFEGWSQRALTLRGELLTLLDDVRNYDIPVPSGDHDSMLEYDHRRLLKETLLERIIETNVELASATRLLLAAANSPTAARKMCQRFEEMGITDEDERESIAVVSALLRGNAGQVRTFWNRYENALHKGHLLYVPLARGGEPRRIVAARIRRSCIESLLVWLPRVGRLTEACSLIEAARLIEKDNPVGPGAITEFDELFSIGYRALVESVVASLPQEDDQDGALLVNSLERLTEALLISWLCHSQTLRLSVLEDLSDQQEWEELVDFVQKYGDEIFTQRFLNLPNVRAILHQGVNVWVETVLSSGDEDWKLLDDLDSDRASEEDVIDWLTVILEAIIENYAEYRDYNSTTTQSDRGDMLFILLDFLRLQARYNRVCWNLRPVILAHDVLTRRGYQAAAHLWRQELVARIGDRAETFVELLTELQRSYAMRMPTIADRINERFVKPLVIDRIRAFVEPAMEEAKLNGDQANFEMLKAETDQLTSDPTGVGLDVPEWLEALEDEVDRLIVKEMRDGDPPHIDELMPQMPITYEQIEEQVSEWLEKMRGSDEAARFRG
ncbi:MAG: hypothetical protein ABGX22_23770 [Pirellulaceae bacterium]